MPLNHPWPPDLHPAEAGFKTWTETILRRAGYWDDPTRLDDLTADEFLRIETAGTTTLADLIDRGNAAIASHENQTDRSGHSIIIVQWGSQEQTRLVRLTRSRWPHQVWGKDPRFADLLPKADQTVAEIATNGETDDQKELYRRLPHLRDRLGYYRSRRDESLRVFVSGITGQTGERLEVLLAMVGFIQPRITQKEGARRLGVSRSRTQQLLGQLWRAWDKAAPPSGVWQLQEWADQVRSSGLSRRRSG
jgi:hypothetical protein